MTDARPAPVHPEPPKISGEGFAVLDSSFRIVYAGGGVASLLGAGGSIPGRSLVDILGPAAGREAEPALRRALETGSPVRLAWESVEVEARPALGGLVIHFQNPNTRFAKLDAAVRNSPHPAALFSGPGLRCELHNPALAAIFPGRSLSGQSAASVLAGFADGLLPSLEDAVREGSPRRMDDIPARLRRTPDGPEEDGWFDVSCVPLGNGAVLLTATETTGRVRERKALARRAAELEATTDSLGAGAIEAAGIGTWSWDLANGETVWSGRTRELFGLPPEAAPGYDAFLSVLHPADRGRVNAAIQTSISAGTEYNAEYRVCHPDGSIRWLQGIGHAQTDGSGRPLRMHGVVIDISARKQAEDALRESEARLRMAIATADLGLWERDLETNVITASERVAETFGLRGPHLNEKDFAARIHPEDRGRVLAAFERAVAGTGAYDLDYRVQHPAGIRWLRSTGTVLRDDSGRPVRVLGLMQEITARREAEERLRISEQLYRGIVESTQEGVWVVDTEGATLYANRQMAEMMGCDAAAMPGRPVFDFTFPEDLTRARGDFREAVASPSGLQVSLRLRRADGATVWTEGATNPIYDAHGRVAALVGMFTDVTARRKAEAERERLLEEQRSQRELLEKLVANSPVAIAVAAGPEHRYILANAAYDALAGASVLGRTVEEAFPGERGRRGRAHYEEVCRTGKPVSLRQHPVEPGAEPSYWSSDYVPLLGAGGNPESVLILTRDVTDIVSARDRAERFAAEAERRAREAETATLRFRRLIEGGIIGIAVANPARIFEANDAFLEIIGYSREELATLDWQAVTTPDTIDLDQRAIRDICEKGFCKPYEKAFFRKDGSRVPILLGATLLSPPPDPQWIAFIVDLTERKDLEEQLRHAQKMESIGVLAGGIAHDFNNILTGILGHASLVLQAMHEFDPARHYLHAVLEAGERAANLTRQLLAYAGKGRFVIGPVDLSAEVGVMVGLLRASIPANVQVEMDLGAGLPAIEADSAQIQQVIMNLVLNAAEAVGDTHGTVVIRTRPRLVDRTYTAMRGSELEPGAYVALEIEDTGCGMDGAVMARIFEPFFTTKFTGRGLGLAAVQGIVKVQRGDIRVYSEPGKGSHFVLLFPAAHAPAPAQAPREASPAGLQGDGTVLVVDDEETVRRVARAALERYGYTVVVAENGREAVEIFRQMHARIRVVVLDATMPVMSGEEALREIRRIRPDVSVVLSSGYSRAETARRFGGALDGFIGKPYTAAALARAVKAACHPLP